MTIRLSHSVFIHIPRTAGMYFGQVCALCGLTQQVLKGDVDSHFAWRQLPEPWRALQAFSFVRHPLAWAASRWSHALEIRAKEDGRHFGVHRLFDECVVPTFASTLRRIMAERPGLVGATFSEMTHGPVRLARTEDLPGAALRLLIELEPGCDLRPAAAVLPFNGTSQMAKYKAEIEGLDPALAVEFLRSETHALEIWEGAKR